MYVIKSESFLRNNQETTEKNKAIQEFCNQAFEMPKGHFAELKTEGFKAIIIHGMHGELSLYVNGKYITKLFCSSQVWEALA